MMHPRNVFVDLPKDRRLGFSYSPSPVKEANWSAFHLLGKGTLCSGKNAHRRCGIIRRSKPSSTSVEVDCPKLVTDLVELPFALARANGRRAGNRRNRRDERDLAREFASAKRGGAH